MRSIAALVLLGIPDWPLINKGTVNAVYSLLRRRAVAGLATLGEARALRALGHPRPWSVTSIDARDELDRLADEIAREGRN